MTPTDWRVVNSMVMLDDMTETNGPTRVVPDSHKWTPINVPDVNMNEVKRIEVRPEDEPIIPKDPTAQHPKEIKLTGKAGSVAVINGRTNSVVGSVAVGQGQEIPERIFPARARSPGVALPARTRFHRRSTRHCRHSRARRPPRDSGAPRLGPGAGRDRHSGPRHWGPA